MAFSWDDPAWVGDFISGLIGIVGLAIAILQFWISQTQGEILTEQKKLTSSVAELQADVKSISRLSGTLTVEHK